MYRPTVYVEAKMTNNVDNNVPLLGGKWRMNDEKPIDRHVRVRRHCIPQYISIICISGNGPEYVEAGKGDGLLESQHLASYIEMQRADIKECRPFMCDACMQRKKTQQ